MLKKMVFVSAVILMLFHVAIIKCAAQKREKSEVFQLSGTLIGESTKFVVLKFTDGKGQSIIDTCYIKNGKLSFQGNIVEPTLGLLSGIVKTNNYEDPNTLRFFIEPKKMSVFLIEDHFPDAKVTGSDTQREMDLLKEQNQALRSQSELLHDKSLSYSNRIRTSSNKDSIKVLVEERDRTRSEQAIIQKNIKSNEIDFVKNHPNSYASPYLFEAYIGNRSIPTTLVKSIYQSFANEVRESQLGQHNQLSINNRIASDQMALSKQRDILAVAALENEKGEKIKLGSFLGKSLVIVDFWASWCVPCLKSSPHLKKVYHNYSKEGLQLVTISIDKKRDGWLSAVKKNGYGIFVNLLDIPNRSLSIDDLKNAEEIPLSRKWNIEYVPTIMLFDEKGLLLSTFNNIDDNYRIVGLEEKIKEFYMKNNR